MSSIFARSLLSLSFVMLANGCASGDEVPSTALSVAPLDGDDMADAGKPDGAQAEAAGDASAPQGDASAATDGATLSADAEKLGAGNRAFAFELFRAVGAGHAGENVALSPYAASSSLAMVFAGARRLTEAEMGATLHFDVPAPALHAAFAEVTRALTDGAGGQGLKLAGDAWVRSDLQVLPAFSEVLRASYGGPPQPADFAGDAAGARAAINARVAEHTGTKIRELLQPSDVSAQTQLLLTSAAYLGARWQAPFDASRTVSATFTGPDGAQAQVPTMQASGSFAHARGDQWEAVALPFTGGALSLVAVLPREGAFDAVEGAMSARWFDDLRGALKPEPLTVAMPKLALRARTSLRPALEALDLRSLFRGADLSGICEDGVVLSDVVQETAIELTEDGAQAASDAGTGAGADVTGASVRFDRPFLYAVVDGPTGQVLFLGRVLRPEG